MIDYNTLPLDRLYSALVPKMAVRTLLTLARDEDLGETGDITSRAMVPEDRMATYDVVPREPGVVCGLAVVGDLFEIFGCSCAFEMHTTDGAEIEPGRSVLSLRGSQRELLAVERTLLNVVARLSGIATLTRKYVDACAGHQSAVCDTRKTLPGWRFLEKYAVRCGGGTLHRVGLFDALLIKDNHLVGLPTETFVDRVSEAIRAARAKQPLRFVEIEVDTQDQLRQVMQVPEGLVDIVLLDNMPPEMLREAVAMRDTQAPNLLLEASGGIGLRTIAEVAATGVDRISIGAITQRAVSLDFGMDASA